MTSKQCPKHGEQVEYRNEMPFCVVCDQPCAPPVPGPAVKAQPHQCAALDENGIRCKDAPEGEYVYHGEHEIYNFTEPKEAQVTWVVVPLCMLHARGVGENAPYSEAEMLRKAAERYLQLATALEAKQKKQV